MRTRGGPDKAHAYLEKNKDRFIERLQQFIRQPSVSTEAWGITESAMILAGFYREAGFQEVEVVETGGYPAIWAYYDAGCPKTIVSYGFFDTRPAREAGWKYPPFGGVITRIEPYGRVIVGRGAASPKGPHLCWLSAVEAMIATDSLPVNVAFLVEGEEILGSPHYAELIDRFRPRLAGATAAFSGGCGQDTSGEVSIMLGFRSLLYIDLVASGKAWGRGPQGSGLHSSNKNVVDSPVWRLVGALNELATADGNSVKIPGFYDDLAGPPAEDLPLIDALIAKYGEDGIQNALGVGSLKALAGDAKGRQLLLKYLYTPSFNINGLRSGYVGPGSEVFTLPGEATARLDLRLPPKMTCMDVVEKMRRHLDATGYPDVEIRVLASADWSRTPLESDLVRAVKGTYESYGLRPSVWPFKGGGGPWSLYCTALGLPLVNGAGLGAGARSGADEVLVIDGNDRVGGIVESAKSHVDIVHRYAEM
jgi:acetylornithine deacetylase/succinyl-diaminopimelate desuccinylase-like protein